MTAVARIDAKACDDLIEFLALAKTNAAALAALAGKLIVRATALLSDWLTLNREVKN
jgi:hypothetical protein